MGAVGSPYDNAMVESFWGRMQVELLNRRRWKTRIELASAIHDYCEHFHNTRRRHSALEMLRPKPKPNSLKPNSPRLRDERCPARTATNAATSREEHPLVSPTTPTDRHHQYQEHHQQRPRRRATPEPRLHRNWGRSPSPANRAAQVDGSPPTVPRAFLDQP